MNIKQLIKEVEGLNILMNNYRPPLSDSYYEMLGRLKGIKQTVEAVDNITGFEINWFDLKDWQTLKKLLGVK